MESLACRADVVLSRFLGKRREARKAEGVRHARRRREIHARFVLSPALKTRKNSAFLPAMESSKVVIIFECGGDLMSSRYIYICIYITTLQMLSYGATCFSAFNGMNFGNVVEFCLLVSSGVR